MSIAGADERRVDMTNTKSGYIETNGISYYYEVRGHGTPVLLLHGGLGTIEMFSTVTPQLTDKHTVIAVDLQGHGRSSLGDRPISLIGMGDDMATLVERLGYPQVEVMGYSLGAGVAFRMAVQHPAAVSKLVLVSAGYSSEGFYPEMRPMQAQVSAAMAPMMKDTPMYKQYVAVAPRPDDFPKLLDKLGALMRETYDWSAEVGKVTAPTLLVCGDSDMFRLDHIVEFYKLLGGGQRDAGWQREHMAKNRLAILPNATHYDIFVSPQLTATVVPFLDGTWTAPTWAEQISTR